MNIGRVFSSSTYSTTFMGGSFVLCAFSGSRRLAGVMMALSSALRFTIGSFRSHWPRIITHSREDINTPRAVPHALPGNRYVDDGAVVGTGKQRGSFHVCMPSTRVSQGSLWAKMWLMPPLEWMNIDTFHDANEPGLFSF